MENHGVGQRKKNNGENICDFCDTNQLVITSTLFKHKTYIKHETPPMEQSATKLKT